MATEPTTQISPEYDLEKVRAHVLREKAGFEKWLKDGGRDPRLLDSFVIRITVKEAEGMIKHIDGLTSMLSDDFK